MICFYFNVFPTLPVFVLCGIRIWNAADGSEHNIRSLFTFAAFVSRPRNTKRKTTRNGYESTSILMRARMSLKPKKWWFFLLFLLPSEAPER